MTENDEGQEVEIEPSTQKIHHSVEEQCRRSRRRRISCSVECIVKYFVIGTLVTAGIVGLSLAFLGTANPIEYFVPVDPPGYKEAKIWQGYDKSTAAGLYLTVENACDDDWVEYFDQSILDWNETDALIVNPVRTSYDYDCRPVYGRLRVCNGDYGNTDWRGINAAVLSVATEKIVESVSKLNDYHIKGSPVDMLYTMCHENGHGFGLPHTDDNHFNRDRGDCMDYTNSPENNLVPGQFNLDLLETLYGTPERPLRLRDANLDNTSTTTTNNNDVETIGAGGAGQSFPPMYINGDGEKDKNKKDKDKDKDRGRHLRGQTQYQYQRHGQTTTTTDSATLQLDEDNNDSINQDDQAFLQEHVQQAMDECLYGYCVYNLNEKYQVRVNKLLVAEKMVNTR